MVQNDNETSSQPDTHVSNDNEVQFLQQLIKSLRLQQRHAEQRLSQLTTGETLHASCQQTYIDKRRAYFDSKKSNPTTDGDNNDNGTHNVRFVNGEDPSGGSLPSILCNGGSTDSRVQGGESTGTPILPSNAACIRNLISNNHIM